MMKKGISGSCIKLVAIIAMVIDHLGSILLMNGFILDAPYHYFTDQQFSLLLKVAEACNVIGSLAFPLFCFLLVEGFCHTKNVRRYGVSLLIFAVISEPIYDWALSGKLIDWQGQNVYFTLLLGLLTLSVIKKSHDNLLVGLVACSVSGLVSYFSHLDGWYYGILLMTIFYCFRDKKALKDVSILSAIYLCALDMSLNAWVSPYFIVSASSLLLIANYNGKRGLRLKFFFYWFYPIHLVLLKLLALVVVSSF